MTKTQYEWIWRKIGLVDVPDRSLPWMYSHCQLPTALPLTERCVRVYFASRTEQQRSHIGYVDLEVDDDCSSFSVVDYSKQPVLNPGPIGFFDEHGVYPSCIVKDSGRWYMYYIGWNQGVERPLFYAAIGLAISEDGKNFRRSLNAPLLSRSEVDPCLVTSPHVYKDRDRWRMTYVSGISWSRDTNGVLKSRYHIKTAESNNIYEWQRSGNVAIDFQGDETNIARSAVVKFASNDYRMWYSYVSSSAGSYRIGYAESMDGTNWRRKDNLAGITIGDELATKMICYPCIFTLGRNMYMLYNGDDFGRCGFGIARYEQKMS
jgi:predicted GH43/DUF377 family glycosyl hydrolase